MALTCALVLSAVVNLVISFSFDTDFPIVYTDPLSINRPSKDRNSYFGYSVILHHEDATERAWVLVGAPRANCSKSRSKEPGGVFRCNIFGPCNFIDVDSYSAKSDILQSSFTDKMDGAWIGGAMDIDDLSGRVVVCGHRWVNQQNDDFRMEGACYWSPVNETNSEKMLPFVDKQDYDKNPPPFYYALGQAGFSAHFSTSKNKSELLLGAPGVYNWHGTTLLYRDGPESFPIANRLTAEVPRHSIKRAAAFTELTNINIASATDTRAIAAFALFGCSVTSGYFFNKDKLLYVSGAPRSKFYVGQILVFEFATRSDQALIVKYTRQGYQLGEYFGAALAAGDIDRDGFDDLIVGAPFYKGSTYNEGRIFIFLGNPKGTFETPLKNSIIKGKAVGGQFGATIMFLSDLHFDGDSYVAVGAPYENGGTGVVFIYQSLERGLNSEPCQKIVGKSFVPDIKGFGISLTKPADIDSNFYKDLAIGAYASGHVVLLRGKPVVTLQQSLKPHTSHLDYDTEVFYVEACFWYTTGVNMSLAINVTRTIIVDELLQRAFLSNMILSTENITLHNDFKECQNITVFIKQDIKNRYDPITVTIRQELITPEIKPEAIHVIPNLPNNNRLDKFCKNCPVSNKFKSAKDQKIELSYAVDCGEDKICITKLDVKSVFLNVGPDNRYVLGSTDYLKLKVTVVNTGEKAYLTQLLIELPKSVNFRSLPSKCLEQNSSSIISCSVKNPLHKNKEKTIFFDLDMKEVNSEKYGDVLNFTLTVLTSSENSNKNTYVESLYIVGEADIALTGKTSQQSYSYGNNTYGKPKFTQTYQVEKFGVSPIEEVFLTIKIPTHIREIELINFLHLYQPEGYLAGQPINCWSNVNYISDGSEDTLIQFDPKDDAESMETFVHKVTTTTHRPATRSTREVKYDLSSQEEKLHTNKNETEFEYPSNRTFYINCSNTEVTCSYVNCSFGPFKVKRNIAILQVKMLFDVSSLLEKLGTKDIIIFSTDGMVSIQNPSKFLQSGYKPDSVRVFSLFIGETPEFIVEMWMIIVAVVAGLLLLLLVTLGLVKAGFFQRTKKKELQALKEAEEVEQFKQELETNCEADNQDIPEESFDIDNDLYGGCNEDSK